MEVVFVLTAEIIRKETTVKGNVFLFFILILLPVKDMNHSRLFFTCGYLTVNKEIPSSRSYLMLSQKASHAAAEFCFLIFICRVLKL